MILSSWVKYQGWLFTLETCSFATLGVEIGWMGYLYPKMEKLCGIIPALIATGIIRGLWRIW